jgi:ribosomal protein S18 acetylase RimI-like enzyme
VNKQKIKYLHGDQALLGEIRVLWEALNRHHLDLSTNFKQHYRELTFEQRKADLLKKAAAGKMRVDLAMDAESGRNVGYCVSSLNRERAGEIESIFVDAAYRGLGVGDCLMKNALRWMDHEGAMTKIVEVGAGNEQAFGFYEKYGFLPRKTVLKIVEKNTKFLK